MSRPQQVKLERGDVVAVRLPPGPEWLGIVHETLEAGAALFPLDHRLPEPLAAELVRRGRPTVVRNRDGTRRLEGDPAELGVALILHTSGTADGPKLVRLSRSAVEAAVASSSEALGATSEDAWLCCLPIAHVGGLLAVLRGVLLGATVEVHPRFDADAVAASSARFTSLVPTMLARLVDTRVELSTFRAILVGGSRLSLELRERAERVGARVVETYGLTESCGGVVYDGRALEGTEVRIGPDDEIELRGPTLLSGYRPEGGELPVSADGWLRTGDAGGLDEHGLLRVLGRLDDVIVTGGEKVSPGQVEAALLDRDGVREAAVAGRPDPEWGERVVAWVVPEDASNPPTLGELREALAAVLPRHAAPRELRVVARLPMTFSGKVRRAALPRD